MWLEIIGELINYCVIRYPVPEIKWDKRKFELRMLEIFTYEKVLQKCMDNPTKDPIDILEDHLLYLHMAGLEFKDNDIRSDEYKKMKNVMNNLIAKYYSKELGSGRIYI